MSDARLDELLNAELDDTLDEKERRELQHMLQASQNATRAQREYRQLDGFLRDLPVEPVPQALRERVVSSVRLPAGDDATDQPDDDQPWASPATRIGLAVAAGVLLSIGLYNVIGPGISDAPRSDMVGTMVPHGGSVLDRLQLDGGDFAADASLKRIDDRLLLDLDLDSARPVEIAVDFSGTGFTVDSATTDGGEDAATSGASVLRFNSSGERTIRIVFSRAVGASAAGTAAIHLEVASEGREAQQGTLRLAR